MVCSNKCQDFQASLKVVREKLVPNFPKDITNAQHPKDQIIYKKEDAVNKNDAFILR